MLSVKETFGAINGVSYKLDLSGVVALFGGIYAIAALDTIHLYKGRRWLGWYNYPGMVDVARKYGQLAGGPIWDTIFPGEGEPMEVFGLAGKSGPNYAAFFSGTRIGETGYLGYLLQQHISRQMPRKLKLWDTEGYRVRVSMPGNVSIVKLGNIRQDNSEPVPRKSSILALFSLIPTFVSTATGVVSLLAEDYVCAALIFSGMLSSGISTFCLGSAQLRLNFPKSDNAAPPADGLMGYNHNEFVILKGTEQEVGVITRGEFKLAFDKNQGKSCHAIGITSLLLTVQFLAQLLLIQIATLFGQQMYLVSLLASGAYHLYMAAHARERVQEDLLVQQLQPEIEKVTLGTRAQMVVFVCLVSQEGQKSRLPHSDILKLMIPNDTPVWRRWRESVVAALEAWRPGENRMSIKYLEAFLTQDDIFSGRDKELYENLIKDARCVFEGYEWEYRGKSKVDVSQLPV